MSELFRPNSFKTPKENKKAKVNEYYLSSIKDNNVFSQIIILIFLFFTISSMALIIALIVQNSNVVSKLSKTDKKTNKCFQNIDFYSEQSEVWLAHVNGNQTTVIVDNNGLQQFQINHVFSNQQGRGRLSFLSKQNEIWIPLINDNIIEIYQPTTMNYLGQFSTLNSGNLTPCYNPQGFAYNPVAGSGNRGQVWTVCEGSTLGWAIFDPDTKEYLHFIPVPDSYAGYVPSDISVGKDYTLVSLWLFPNPLLPNLIQYDNIHFLPTGVSATIGNVPIFSHGMPMNNILYISTFNNNIVYKFNFLTLEIIHEWTNFTSPWGTVTDESQNVLYITESEANQIRIVSTSYPYDELSFSPVPTEIPNPTFMVRSYNNNLYMTSLSNQSYLDVFNINGLTKEPIHYATLNTGAGSFFLDTSTINCLCELCI